VSTPQSGAALMNEDGDRFYRLHPSGVHLTHWFLKVPSRTDVNWEARSTADRAVGRHVFHHVLLLHDAQAEHAALVRRAEELKRPVRWRAVRLDADRPAESLLRVRPDCVRLSAFHPDGAHLMLRLYNPTPDQTETEVTLPEAPREAGCVNFHGEPLQKACRLDGNLLGARLLPWEIATFRLTS